MVLVERRGWSVVTVGVGSSGVVSGCGVVVASRGSGAGLCGSVGSVTSGVVSGVPCAGLAGGFGCQVADVGLTGEYG